jgi:succinate dehydrogenase / fumarate reductase, cytochrome b subunit
MYKTTGFLSFALRRISGLALVFYLFTHIWVISSALGGPEAFDARLNLVQTPFFKLAEIALLAAVVYHAFDGVRLLIINWFKVTDRRKAMFYAVFVISFLMVVAGGVPILLFMLQG